MTFIASLVFALCFSGVWEFKEACHATGPDCIKDIVIGIVFVAVAYILPRIA